MTQKRIIHAPRGNERSCRGWHQEAAMRMLMNNLDPDVAEAPDRLVVYGGTGRAARSWEAFDAIVRSLRELENDETLLVQSGKPVGKFRTHDEAPRVLIANSNLVGQWNNYTDFNLVRGFTSAARGSFRGHSRLSPPPVANISADRWKEDSFSPADSAEWAVRNRSPPP